MKFSPNKLIKHRGLAGITQADLAKLVDTDQSRIGKYESGSQSPRKTMIYRLADALEVDYDDLCNTLDKDINIEVAADFAFHFVKEEHPKLFEELLSQLVEAKDVDELSAHIGKSVKNVIVNNEDEFVNYINERLKAEKQ